MTQAQTQRKYYLDFLRIFSAFLVIYLHTDGFRFYLNHNSRPVVMIGYIFTSVLTTVNVPTFFMVSGALLLGRAESYRKLFSVRMKRIAVILVLFSFLVYCIYAQWQVQIPTFLSCFFSATITAEYWFMYAYLGFLLALPFLRKIAGSLTDADSLLMLLCAALFLSVIPALLYICNRPGCDPITMTTYFSFPFAMTDILFYPLMGYYLDQTPIEKFGKKGFCGALLLLIGGSLIATAITYHEGTHLGYTANYLTLFKPTSTISFFYIIKYLFSKIRLCKTGRLIPILTAASSTCFGIYLMDPIFRYYVYQNPVYDQLKSSFWVIPYALCYSLVSLFVCGTVTHLLKKAPILKNYL